MTDNKALQLIRKSNTPIVAPLLLSTELNTKLSHAGFKPKSYGTPILDVHGIMLPNNPKLSLIKSTMQERYLDHKNESKRQM